MERYCFTTPTPFDRKINHHYLHNTLSEPYYEKMIGNDMQKFMEMVWSRELIENGIKKKIEGKPTSAPLARKATLAKKKEGDAHVVFVNQQFRGQASYAS